MGRDAAGDAWSARLDELESSLISAAGGQAPCLVGFDDLGPLPPGLRARAADLLARLTAVEVVVSHRIEQVDTALRLGAPAGRARNDQAPAPAYLDHLA